jgi:hypothetical protein
MRCGNIVDDEQRRDCPQYVFQRVPAAQGQMQGAATQAMRCHRRGAATKQMSARQFFKPSNQSSATVFPDFSSIASRLVPRSVDRFFIYDFFVFLQDVSGSIFSKEFRKCNISES